jgi:FAR1 DNA-binding domain-containing protein
MNFQSSANSAATGRNQGRRTQERALNDRFSGCVFPSWVAAREAVDEALGERGFAVRKRGSGNVGTTDGAYKRHNFECTRAGHSQGRGYRKRTTNKTGCPFRLHIRLVKTGWEVVITNFEHNHTASASADQRSRTGDKERKPLVRKPAEPFTPYLHRIFHSHDEVKRNQHSDPGVWNLSNLVHRLREQMGYQIARAFHEDCR